MNWEKSVFQGLEGKTVTRVYVHNDYEYITFVLSSGEKYTYVVTGDCCSVSWFYSVTGVNNLLGQTIRGVTEADTSHVNLNDGLCRQDVDLVYGYNLVTDKGDCTIIFRNSSNGYYGGYLEWCEDGNAEQEQQIVMIDSDWVYPSRNIVVGKL